jgi:hypothetical protein
MTVIFDIEVETDIENLSSGVLLRDDRGVFLHSKYLFQADASAQRNAKAGTKFRAAHSLRLDLNAGKYTVALDLFSVPAEAFQEGKLTLPAFDLRHQPVCSTGSIFAFTVRFNTEREGAQFSHFGTFDLPSRITLREIS